MVGAIGVLVSTPISECRLAKMYIRVRNKLRQVAIRIGVTLITDLDAVGRVSSNDKVLQINALNFDAVIVMQYSANSGTPHHCHHHY